MKGELRALLNYKAFCFSYKFLSGIELNSLLTKCISSIPGKDLEVKIQDLLRFYSIMMHLIINTPKMKR